MGAGRHSKTDNKLSGNTENQNGGGNSHRQSELPKHSKEVSNGRSNRLQKHPESADGGRSRRHNRKGGGNRAGKICSMTGMLLIIAVILLCSLLVLPGMIGFHMYHVLSGSMEPTVPVGSLLYVKGGEAKDVENEEVIAFYSSVEDSGIITHRVVKNNVVSGTFTTKGDANDKEDPTPVPYDNYIGKVVLSIPYIGKILTIMTSLEGKIAAACVVGIGVLLNLIGGRLKDREEE